MSCVWIWLQSKGSREMFIRSASHLAGLLPRVLHFVHFGHMRRSILADVNKMEIRAETVFFPPSHCKEAMSSTVRLCFIQPFQHAIYACHGKSRICECEQHVAVPMSPLATHAGVHTACPHLLFCYDAWRFVSSWCAGWWFSLGQRSCCVLRHKFKWHRSHSTMWKCAGYIRKEHSRKGWGVFNLKLLEVAANKSGATWKVLLMV